MQKNKNSIKYDVILLDLHMPIMNGFDACKNICDLYEEPLFAVNSKREKLLLDDDLCDNIITNSAEKLIMSEVEKKMKKIKPLIVASTGLLSERVIEDAKNCGFDHAF